MTADRKKNNEKIIGACEKMCSATEVETRLTHNIINYYEKNNNLRDSHNYSDKFYLVKEFVRSSADQAFPLATELRTVAALQHTMNHLLDRVAYELPTDTEIQSVWYDFLFNRFRAIIKDITQQQLFNGEVCEIIEQMGRFYIFCHAFLSETVIESYNRKANLSALASCIEMINKFNNTSSIYNSKPLSTIIEYKMYEMLLNFVNNVEFVSMLKTLPLYLAKTEPIEWVVCLYYFYHSDRSYEYFLLLKQKFPYLVKCLIQEQSSHMRKNCFKKLRRSYSSHGKGNIRMSKEMIVHSFGLFSDKMLNEFILEAGDSSSSDSKCINLQISLLNYDIISNGDMDAIELSDLNICNKNVSVSQIITIPTLFIEPPNVNVFATYAFCVDEAAEEKLNQYAQSLESSPYIYEDALSDGSFAPLKGDLYADIISRKITLEKEIKKPEQARLLNNFSITSQPVNLLTNNTAIDIDGRTYDKMSLLNDSQILCQLLEIKHGITVFDVNESPVPLLDIISNGGANLRQIISTSSSENIAMNSFFELNNMKLPLWQFIQNPLLNYCSTETDVRMCVVVDSDGIKYPLDQFLFDSTTSNVLDSIRSSDSIENQPQLIRDINGVTHLCSSLMSDPVLVECLRYSRNGPVVYDHFDRPHNISTLLQNSLFASKFHFLRGNPNNTLIAEEPNFKTVKDQFNNSYDVKQFVYNSYLHHILSESINPACIFDSSYNCYPIGPFLFNIHISKLFEERQQNINVQVETLASTYPKPQSFESSFMSNNNIHIKNQLHDDSITSPNWFGVRPVETTGSPQMQMYSSVTKHSQHTGYSDNIVQESPHNVGDWLSNINVPEIRMDSLSSEITSTRDNFNQNLFASFQTFPTITHNLMQQNDQTEMNLQFTPSVDTTKEINKIEAFIKNEDINVSENLNMKEIETDPFNENTSMDSVLRILTKSFYETSFYSVGHSRMDMIKPLKDPDDHKKNYFLTMVDRYVKMIINKVIRADVTDIYSKTANFQTVLSKEQFKTKKDIEGNKETPITSETPLMIVQGKKRKINYISDFHSLWFNQLIVDKLFNMYEVTLSDKSKYNFQTASPWCTCVVIFDNFIHTPMLQSHSPSINNLMHLIYLKLFRADTITSTEQCFSVNYECCKRFLFGHTQKISDKEAEKKNNDYVNSVIIDCNRGLVDFTNEECKENSSSFATSFTALSVHDVTVWNQSTEIALQNATSIICLLSEGGKRYNTLIEEIKSKLIHNEEDLNRPKLFNPSFFQIVVSNSWRKPPYDSYDLYDSDSYDLWVNALDMSCESFHSMCEVILRWAVNSSFWVPDPTVVDGNYFVKDFKQKILLPLNELNIKYQNQTEWFTYVDSFVQVILNDYLSHIQDSIRRNLSYSVYPFERKDDPYYNVFYAIHKGNLITEDQCNKLTMLNRLLKHVEIPPLIHICTSNIEECHEIIENFFNHFNQFLRILNEIASRHDPTLLSIRKEMICRMGTISNDNQLSYCISFMPFFIRIYPAIIEKVYNVNINIHDVDNVEINLLNETSSMPNTPLIVPFNVIRDVTQKQWSSNLIEAFESSELYLGNSKSFELMADKNLTVSSSPLKKYQIAQTIVDYIDDELDKLFPAT